MCGGSVFEVRAFWFFGLAGRGMCSVLGVLGYMDSANLSKNRHGACSMSEVPRKGNALGIVKI